MARINRKKYPALFAAAKKKSLDTNNLPVKYYATSSMLNACLSHGINNDSVRYASQTFLDAAKDNHNRIIDLFDFKEGVWWYLTSNFYGCVMVESAGKIPENGKVWVLAIRANEVAPIVMHIDKYGRGLLREALKPTASQELIHELAGTNNLIIAMHAFREMAETFGKKMPPSGKSKIGCKYMRNDLPFSVENLSENWYTNSLQLHPFRVKGHWRMQACGEGWKDRKIKWIDAYIKKGHKIGAYKTQRRI